jgi:fucose permease
MQLAGAVSASYQLMTFSRQLALASLGFVSLGLPEGLLGVAWPSIRATFGLPLDALGLLLGTFATGYFVASAVSGWIIGRFGIGTVLAVSCGLTGTCLIGYSLSPAWISMVGLGAFVGMGAGTIDGGLNTYAAIAHGPRVLNWMHAAFGIGAAVGPLIMTAILSGGMPWNVGYALVAAAQLALAAAYWLTRGRYITPSIGWSASDGSLADTQSPVARDVMPPSALNQLKRDSSSPRALLAMPLAWISLALFFVYVGAEAGVGQWSYSLFTLSRGAPTALAGGLVSAYWASLTVGRLLFGVLVTRVRSDNLLRACMLTAVVASALVWANVPVASWLAVAVLGLVFAPIFPVLIADTPARLGQTQTANAVGLQVAAAVLGGAGLPALLGVLAAHSSLEVVGPCLLIAAIVLFALHELLARTSSAIAYEQR